MGVTDVASHLVVDSNTQKIKIALTLKEVPHELFLFPTNYNPAEGTSNSLKVSYFLPRPGDMFFRFFTFGIL